jgi:hypothetical protein
VARSSGRDPARPAAQPAPATPPDTSTVSPASATPLKTRRTAWFGSSSPSRKAVALTKSPSAGPTVGHTPPEMSASEKLARERLREAEFAFETQQRMYKEHIADLSNELDALTVGGSVLGDELHGMDGELERKDKRLNALRAELDELLANLKHAPTEDSE